MRIIGYARVSSREQAENSHTLEQQIARLKAAGATEIYSDVESGSRDLRAAFNQVIDLIRSNQCDEVIITRLDRLTRSLPTLRKALDEFRKSSVNLRTLDDSIDLSTAAGKFHLNMLGALAEMEVDRLSERVAHGWQHLRDRKVAMNSPFGYVKVANRHELDHAPFLCLIETHTEYSKATIAEDILATFFQVKSLGSTIKAINVKYGIQRFSYGRNSGVGVRGLFRWSRGGLSNWLTSPILQGHTCYFRSRKGQRQSPQNWIIHHDTYPTQRLLNEDEAAEIQAILKHNQQVRGYGSTALKYPLSGLVYCGECRGTCYSLSGQKNYHHPERGYNYYFQCKNYPLRACGQKKTTRMEIVEVVAIKALIQRTEAITNLADQSEHLSEPVELQELRSQLQSLEQIPGYQPAIETAKQDLRNQIQNFQHELD